MREIKRSVGQVAFLAVQSEKLANLINPLQETGFNIRFFSSAEEVLEAMLTGPYKALIIMLPYQMEGEPAVESVIYALRHCGIPEKAHLPIVAIHNQLTPSLIQHFDKAGVSACFTSHQFMTQAKVVVKGLILAASD